MLGMAGMLAISAPARAEPNGSAPMEVIGNRLFVPMTINGTPVEALLDSGAEMTVVDYQLAERLHLALSGGEEIKGTGGTMPARFASGVSLGAAGIELTGRDVVVLDLEDVSTRLVGRPVGLILGRDLFDAARLRIDFRDNSVTAVPHEPIPPGRHFELTTRHGIETFPVSIEGHAPVQADFDLGNGSEVLIGKAYAERIGLTEPERLTGRKAGGGLGGGLTRDQVILKSLRIGDRVFTDVPAAIDERANAVDVNVGTALLRHFLITVDYAQHALWLEPIDA